MYYFMSKTKLFLKQLNNKCIKLCEKPGYPSNWPHDLFRISALASETHDKCYS